MRVVMLADCAYQDRASGVERATSSLVAGLRDLSVDVTVLSPRRVGSANPSDPGTRVVDMGGRYQLLYGYRDWIRAAHETLATLSPDIVHGQGLLHNGLAAAMWNRCPTAVTAHGNPVEDARWHYSPLMVPALSVFLRHVANRTVTNAKVVVNVTPDWRANCPRQPAEQVYIPNPILPAFYGSEPPAPTGRVLFFGGLRAIKGLDLLLDAWPAIAERRPDATLHVWGMTGDEDSPLIARCHQTERCSVEGLVDADGVADAMRGGGVLALPSHFEVAPLAVAEAWAVGIPVVATGVGGVPAYAAGAAFLCPDGDPQALAASVVRALSRDAETESLLKAGRLRAEDQCGRAVATAHLDLYRQLLERHDS